MRGKPVTRYRVLEAIVELWQEKQRPPLQKEIALHCGISRTNVARALRFLLDEGKVNNWLVPLTYRVVLLPVQPTAVGLTS